jgi:hypothetical protein
VRTGALILGAAVGILAIAHLTAPHPRPPTAHRTSPQRPPLVLGGTHASLPAKPASRAAPEDRHAQPRPAPPAATQAARQFLAAYLRWQTGDRTPGTDRSLQATTTRRLWGLLHTGRATPRSAGKASELLATVAAGVAGGQAATLLATLRQAHRQLGLALVLRHGPGGWRVSSLGR